MRADIRKVSEDIIKRYRDFNLSHLANIINNNADILNEVISEMEKSKSDELTVQELKERAKKMGYNLIPIKKREKLLPCVCGRKRLECWVNAVDCIKTVRCPICGLEAKGSTEYESRHAWNEMIKKYKDFNISFEEGEPNDNT